jgi:hypothetical protein
MAADSSKSKIRNRQSSFVNRTCKGGGLRFKELVSLRVKSPLDRLGG